MIDEKDIEKVNSLPIEQVADSLNLTVKQHWSLCPFHADSRPSLYYRVGVNRFHCFVCDRHGGPVDLCRQVNRLSFRDAVCWLADAFGLSIREKHRPFRVKRRTVQPVTAEVVKPVDPAQLTPLVAHPEWTDEARRFLFDERKLDPRVIRWCGISSTHTHLLIPYFGTNGRLQSVQWRYLGPYAHPSLPHEPRFRFPKGSQCHIYGLQILPMVGPHEPLWITEGASDCWAMLSSGRKAIAIPSASLLKASDLQPLVDLHRERGTVFHIFPDNDGPGERLCGQLRMSLEKAGISSPLVRHQLPVGCKDFAEAYVKKLIC